MMVHTKRAKPNAGVPALRRTAKAAAGLLLLAALLSLAGCYPAAYRVSEEPVAPAREPMTQVFFYPKLGQSNEQQARDQYDCYNWAMKQTGYDPSQSSIPRPERVRVVPMPPPGHDTAALAIAGAVLGALIGGPRHAGQGALIGAASGAFAGAASDASRMEAARMQEEAYARRDRHRDAWLDERASNFRRAMGACLEGRGYSVQ